MKILIAVVSCRQHRDLGYHDAIRRTWKKDVSSNALNIYCAFFCGEEDNRSVTDEYELGVNDSYENLHLKTRALYKWALDNRFDYVHKTDTDTLINVPNLLASGFEKHDYMGGFNEDTIPVLRPEPLQFASGGAGYWLSKKALTIVANHAITDVCGEDVFVADALKRQGILPVWHEGYKWRPGEQMTKNTVSLHLSSALQKKYKPEMMYEQYEKMKNLTRENRA